MKSVQRQVVIVIGGDAAYVRKARVLARYDTALIGINREIGIFN